MAQARKATQPENNAKYLPDDPIFFHKGQIRKGTRLVYVGRRDPNSIWIVVSIYSHVRGNLSVVGAARAKAQHLLGDKRTDGQVKYLRDTVLLQRLGRAGVKFQEFKHVGFGCLSYSAIWRLADNGK